jgi:hypothetical protein
MRFMVMHKMTEDMEKGLPPDPEVMAGVGKLIEESLKTNTFLSGEGLRPSSQRVHLTYENGERTIAQGPFADARELIAGFSLIRVGSREEALSWCDRIAEVLGDVRLFLGLVVEAWDLGMGERPDDAPLRFLSMIQADERTERDAPLDAERQAKLSALFDEMTKAGVLEARGELASTKKGARLRFKGGKRTVIDGPFAESKELIAGYAIVELPSLAAAIEFSTSFGDVVKVEEIDIRQLQ